MSITDWFSAREKRRYTEPAEGTAAERDVPDGIWARCDECKNIAHRAELEESAWTCPKCGNHFDVSAVVRLELLADQGTVGEIDACMTSQDPLEFQATKTYVESLDRARGACGLPEAVVTARAFIGGRPVVVGAMDFRFIGASMGSAVGEKVTRAFELATAERVPIVMTTASGGARMQEGMLSLMQMAKTAAAARRHADAGLPFVSVLTNPTYGGVTASFPVLADIVLAEPGAIVGFTGPRVIEQTIRQRLPKGFQSSEFLLEHGMVDAVVPRPELRETITLALEYLSGGCVIAPKTQEEADG
jgi:acetyl-CoA carboxylase carboxyl transferase beta subunit